MSDKKPSPSAQPIVHTITRGPIRILIHRSQSNSGFEYFDFSIFRKFTSRSSSKEGQSQNFFPCNRDPLIESIITASEWIQEQSQAAPASDSPTEVR